MKKRSIELPNVEMLMILAGKPAAGKGFLCGDVFAEKMNLDFDLVETGQMLRDFAKTPGPMAKRVYETMKSGNPVDDDLVIHVVFDALLKCNKKKVVLDGFPRTDYQFKIMERVNIKGTFAGIVIERSDEWVHKRAKERSVETGRSDGGLDRRIHLFTDETRLGMKKLVTDRQMRLFHTRRDVDLLDEADELSEYFDLQRFCKNECENAYLGE